MNAAMAASDTAEVAQIQAAANQSSSWPLSRTSCREPSHSAIARENIVRQVIAALQSKTPSFEFVGGLKMSDPATTPVAFTRGLNAAGTWDDASGAYRSAGGHIIFLGGNVQYYQSIDNRLVNTAGKATNDIRETIPAPTGGNQRIYGKGSAIASEAGVAPVLPGS